MTEAKSRSWKLEGAKEDFSMEDFEAKFGIVGTECGEMFEYIGDTHERSFQNTSGLPEVSVRELGIYVDLVSTRELFDHVDCGALFHSGDDDTPQFGTIGIKK